MVEPRQIVPEKKADEKKAYLHAKLAAQAKRDGVSLNSLVLAFIAEGIGKR